MSDVVIDASVAICWFVQEAGTQRANRLIGSTFHPVAPSLMLAELANTLWKKIRRGEIRADIAEAGLREVRRFVPRIVDLSELVPPAFALAQELGHPVYDCVYLALARRLEAPLLTLDRKLTARLAGTRYQPDAVLLFDWREL